MELEAIEEVYISELTDYQNPFLARTQVLGVVVESTEDIIARYDWDVRLAIAIFKAESNLNPEAINREDRHRGCMGSYGVAQLGCIHMGSYGLTWDNWDDPEANIKSAYLLYREKGWKPWGAFTNGSWKKYY